MFSTGLTRSLPYSPTPKRILLVEDQLSLANPLRRGLQEVGYLVDLALDGVEGETLVRDGTYDALIIDWRLPRMDGRMLIERLRQTGHNHPILILTALRDLDHKIAGLDAGADDYMTKPFAFDELLARLRALLRRGPAPQSDLAAVPPAGPLHAEVARHVVTCDDAPLHLRAKEYRLLVLLMCHQGEVLTRGVIAERIWGSIYEVTDNAIDVTVSGLRQAIGEAAAGMVTIETVRGVGYRLSVQSKTTSQP